MSWQPPPSFTSGEKQRDGSSSRSPTENTGNSSGGKTKKKTWVPPTYVPELPGDMPLAGLNSIMVKEHGAYKTNEVVREHHTSPRGVSKDTTTKTPRKAVGWNQSLFVVDQESSNSVKEKAKDHQQTSNDSKILQVDDDDDNDDLGEHEIQIPSREALGYKSIVSKREHLLVDKTLLRTRLEWSQLLVSKAFKPYRQMICAVDDDLPDPKDIDEIDEADSGEDYLEGKKELIKIRDEMLDDPDLNEKEIAAFFEGFKLFQMKSNSLQSQLDGLKTMQKLQLNGAAQSQVFGSRSMSMLSLGRVGPSKSAFFRESPAIPLVTRRDQDANDESSEQPIITPSKSQPKGFDTSSSSLRTMSIRRIRNQTEGHAGSDDIRKLLEELEEAERRQKKLEKQLAQAGVVIAEDIPYHIAKEKVTSIARRMEEIGTHSSGDKKLQEEYFLLEQDMEKYTAALQLTDEWIEEQEEMERQWEEAVAPGNEDALKKVRRHMPVDVRNRSETSLASDVTPNGMVLPKATAKKFKRTNVLQILRIDPQDIVPMHAATLENMRITGLTLTERRAIYCHLKDIGPRWKAMQGDKMTERKWTWFSMMKANFKENMDSWQRHVDQYGPPGNHPYFSRENPNAGGCPLIGKQCPLKADKAIDYDGDYGYPEGQEYFKTEVKKSDVDNLSKARDEAHEALKEKKSHERSALLKTHYKGKILQVTLANGSCEAMDDTMDTIEKVQENWIKMRLSEGQPTEEGKRKEVIRFKDALKELKLSILQFAERSGMQLTGKRDANADHPDVRSVLELGLCEEVVERAFDFFDGIEHRMMEVHLKDGTVKVTIQQLRSLLDELHERNLNTLKMLGHEKPPKPSRVFKTRQIIEKNVQNELEKQGKALPREAAVSAKTPTGRPGGAGRGDLLTALKGRGGGRGESGSPGPGRGDLLSALQGRGGGRGRGRGGGLMAAIQARGKQTSS